MKGDSLPSEAHVLRYAQPRCIDERDGVREIQGTAFWSRPRDENMTSYNWMECFAGSHDERIQEIRKRARIEYKAKGLLAKLNVGSVMHVLEEKLNGKCLSRFIEDPLNPEPPNHGDDPSHTLMTHMPAEGELLVEAIGDILAECVIDQYPAKA